MAFIISCNTIKNPFIEEKSPHEKYGAALKNAGLDNFELSKKWFSSAKLAISQPQEITIPYKETGFFATDNPHAAGFVFQMKRGQDILISLGLNPDSLIHVFVDLYRLKNEKSSLLTSMDTLHNDIKFTVNEDGKYLVRIQSELMVNVEYTITIISGPSLAFPVAPVGNPKMISYWGSARDAGARSHEGVDIKANFRTPVLAVTDGLVIRVNENKLGGKVVFLKDEKTGNNIYYAHLDSQVAVTGQKIKTGDVLGLIGNTGNARNTIPHLHFGIYTNGGAIDPLAFIDPAIEVPKKVVVSIEYLNTMLHTTAKSFIYTKTDTRSAVIKTLDKYEPVFALSATDKWYKVQSVNNLTGYIPGNDLSAKSLRRYIPEKDRKLLLNPNDMGPVKKIIQHGTQLAVHGILNDYFFVDDNGVKGWIKK